MWVHCASLPGVSPLLWARSPDVAILCPWAGSGILRLLLLPLAGDASVPVGVDLCARSWFGSEKAFSSVGGHENDGGLCCSGEEGTMGDDGHRSMARWRRTVYSSSLVAFDAT